MRWLGNKESSNIDDRRGKGTGGMVLGGGIGTIVIVVIYLLLGGNPSDVVNQVIQQPTTASTQVRSVEEEKLASFTKVVLGLTEQVWDSIYQADGHIYEPPTLVLFTEQTQSGCGSASVATGPFYCSGDEQIYIDLSFFKDLSEKFNAPGDLAMAYVIAHEVGHHIQYLTGASTKIQNIRSSISTKEYNKLSVKLELQADFLAGVWAHHANKLKHIIEPGDIESALTAANAIGDDRLQKQNGGNIVPDAFTHGSSKQRMYWFKKGFETGDIKQGDTFEASNEF